MGAGRRRGQRRRRRGEGVGSLFRYNFRCHPGLLSALYPGCCVVIRTLLSALYTYFIRTLPALSGKVNQIAANSRHFPLRPIHYRWLTQGNYRKTTGKVNRIPANPRHFPLSPIHYRCSTQGNYLKTTRKVNQFAANSRHFPRTEKTGVAAGIYDLQQLTTAKDQALSRAHCGGSFVSGCYRSIIPNAQATSFAVRLPFSGIISIICIAKILSLFFCGFQDSGILTSKPRRAPFICKVLIISIFIIILTHHGRFRECRPVFHPIATQYLLE